MNIKEQLDLISVPEIKLKNEEYRVVLVKNAVLLPKIVTLVKQLDEIISVPEVKIKHEDGQGCFCQKGGRMAN